MSISDEAFREELRGWLAAHPPPAVGPAPTLADAEALRDWQRTLHARRLGRHPLAGRVRRARRVVDPGRDLQRGAGARGRAADPRARRRHARRADADRARHRGAAGAVDAAHPRRRRRLVPAVQRARRGERPRGAVRRAPRSGGGMYRVNGQKVWSSYATLRRHGHRAGADRSDRAAAQRDLDARDPDGRRRASRCGPLRQITGDNEFNEVFLDDVEVPVDNLDRPRARGLACRQHDARQRTGRVVHLEGAGAARGRDRRARRASAGESASTDDPACPAAARAVVDRRRDLPPAQRAARSAGSRAARRSARSRAS